jgi:hypothetical protein
MLYRVTDKEDWAGRRRGPMISRSPAVRVRARGALCDLITVILKIRLLIGMMMFLVVHPAGVSAGPSRDSQVRHSGLDPRSVPVRLAGRDPDDHTGAGGNNRIAADNEALAVDDQKQLITCVGMPSGAGTGPESHDAGPGFCLVAQDRADADLTAVLVLRRNFSRLFGSAQIVAFDRDLLGADRVCGQGQGPFLIGAGTGASMLVGQ